MAAKLDHRAATPPHAPAALTFGPFHLDLRGSRLLRGDQVIPLRPKTWSVLVYLAERPGVLVTKDEFFQALWPNVAVTPDTLNKSIGELRVALGDDSQVPRFIETVHRRGFRFLAAPDAKPAASAAWFGEQPDRSRRPFVGREEELRFLAERLARAQSGERQMVFVTGWAGVGKTALVEAFLGSLDMSAPAAPVWIGRAGCFDHHGPGEAYLAVLEALEQLARPPRVERLVRLMRRAAPMWLAQMPWLLGEGDAAGLRESLRGVRAERMPRELARLIEELTGELTLVLVLEDLHWSDPATVDLITLLAQRREPARLLVIGTYRPAEVAVREHVLLPAVRTLQAQQRCVELPLSDLSAAAVAGYLATRFPGSDFPRALPDLIHAHTGGHPLFVVAVVNHMLSQGWILDTAPGWGLGAPAEALELGVPDDVRLMIDTQLQGLSPAQRALLEAASVAGNEITAAILAAALDSPVGAVELHFETLVRAHQFLRVVGRVEWPDGAAGRCYAFTHELYRQVVYEAIPPARSAALHQRVGEALEAAHGDRATEIAPLLAMHFQHSRDPARALRYLLAAGVRARERFTPHEAVRYLEAALALPPLLADRDEQHRWELQVRLALGRALGDIAFAAPEIGENYARVSALSAALGSAPELFESLYARWYLHSIRADRAEAIALADELTDLADRTGDGDDAALADATLVRTAFYDGRFTDARRHMGSLRARCPGADHTAVPIGYGVDPIMAATMHYAGALWYLGELDGARDAERSGLEAARRSGNPFFLAAIGAQAALLSVLRRDAVEGGRLAADVAALAGEQGFTFWNAVASGIGGYALVLQGNAAAGIVQLDHALDALDATGARFTTGFLRAFLAEGCLRAGAVAKGLAGADAGLALAETSLDRSHTAELWRLKGELLLASAPPTKRRARGTERHDKDGAADANWAEAERCLRRGLEIARAAEARSLELRVTTSLARAWQARRRGGEGRAMLKNICGWFDAETTAPDLVEARTLLAELGSGGAGRPARAHPS